MKLLLCALLFVAVSGCSASVVIEVPSEYTVSLSLTQEAEMALDRAVRWLRAQTLPEDSPSAALAARFFEGKLPKEPDDRTLALLMSAMPKQREPYEAQVQALVNTQQISPEGGHWGDTEQTLCAMLKLRHMIRIYTPPPVSAAL